MIHWGGSTNTYQSVVTTVSKDSIRVESARGSSPFGICGPSTIIIRLATKSSSTVISQDIVCLAGSETGSVEVSGGGCGGEEVGSGSRGSG